MLLKIIIVFAALVAIVLAFAATKPKIFTVQRTINIKAPDKIFELVNDFHNWSGWAPQDKEDPTMKRTYSGAVSGKGAVSEWVSSGSAGKGRMTITESTPYRTSRWQAGLCLAAILEEYHHRLIAVYSNPVLF
jgi:hypothetical protein